MSRLTGCGLIRAAMTESRFIGVLLEPLALVAPAMPEFVVSQVAGAARGTAATIRILGNRTTGVFRWHVSESDTMPDTATIASGAGAVTFGAHPLGKIASQTAGPDGLTPETDYVVSGFLDADENSDVTRVAFRTSAAVTAAPVLSAATVSVSGETTISARVATTRGDGALSWVATTSSAPPTVTQIEAGQTESGATASAAHAQAVSTSGPQSVFGGVTGLTTGTAYFVHLVHRGENGMTSNIVTAGPATPADLVAPFVQSVLPVVVSSGQIDVTFNTDTAEGTAFVLAASVAVPVPTVAQVLSDNSGVGSGMISVSAAGPQNISLTGLAGATDYHVYVMHQDRNNNQSAIVRSVASVRTPSTTRIRTYMSDGFADQVSFFRSDPIIQQPDSQGGSQAVVWSSDGSGGSSVILQMRSLVYHDGRTKITGRVKTLASDSPRMWIRLRAGNTGSYLGLFSIDVTDDVTPGANRVGSIGGWRDVTASDPVDGWVTVSAVADMTGVTDRDGILQINMATANNGSAIPNTVAGANRIALHDFVVERMD